MAIFSFFHSTHYYSFIEVIQVRIGKTLYLNFPSDLSLRMKNLVYNQVHFQEAVTFRKYFLPQQVDRVTCENPSHANIASFQIPRKYHSEYWKDMIW